MNSKILTISLILMFYFRFAFAQDIDGLWEMLGNDDELSSILEYNANKYLNLQSDALGYSFLQIDTLLFILPGITQPVATCYQPELFRLTYRTSGEELGRHLVRGGGSLSKSLRLNLLIERDPGEKWDDFYAGSLTYAQGSMKAILGNYSTGFGQGLVLWRGIEWGAFPENPLYPFKLDFLREYNSTSENGALLGAGVYFKMSRISFLGFYSDSRWDASANDEGISALQTSGEHITTSELENKDRLRELLYGFHKKLKITGSLYGGISATTAHYEPPFAPGDEVRQTFDFAGSGNTVLGSDFEYEQGAFTAVGEFAHSNFGGNAVLARFQLKYDRITSQLSLRNYDRDYKNLRSIAPQGNERGFTMGISLKPWSGGTVNTLLDARVRPWRTYNYEMPPEGYESSIHFSQEVYKFVFSLRLRKTVNNTGVEGLTRNQFRFDIQKEIAGFSLLYRLEMMEAISSQENSLGYLISQRLKTKLFMGKAELALSVFNIPNYDTRIYLYQAEVPGSFAVPFFYGNGFNFNLVYKTSILRNLAIAGRIAFTHYTWKPNSPAGETDQNFSFYFNYNFERKKEAS